MAPSSTPKKWLKGFSKFGTFPGVDSTDSSYSVTGDYSRYDGAYSCAPSDNKTDWNIPADDDPNWDSGSEWNYTDLEVVVRQQTLEEISTLTGSVIETDGTGDLLREGTFDLAPEFAATFAALVSDFTYRAFRYLRCKLMSYSIAHTTRGVNNDAQNYTLHIRAFPRQIDHFVRETSDMGAADLDTWLSTAPIELPAG